MLALRTVELIQELLDEGELSNRKIAAQVDVSRGIVNSISRGERGIWGRIQGDNDRSRLKTPPERCRECGYFVYKPCLICMARDVQAAKAPLRGLMPERKAA